MDSAANNGTMLMQFGNELMLKAPDTTFDDVNSNVHCLDHIINTCSQAFIKNIGTLAPDDGRDGDDVEDRDNYVSGNEGNPGPPPAPGGPPPAPRGHPPAPGGCPPAPGNPPMLDLDAHVIPGIGTLFTPSAPPLFAEMPGTRPFTLGMQMGGSFLTSESTYKMLIHFLKMRPVYLLFRNQSDKY
ncbi:hypothetical protein EVJ58_g9443 [Rhodofomes roseus]|uniref:Uncharacterized protein n=1 Tax=Rhodofomes roseus TaxID=34475 RepID=A0A4Y9XVR9_9APHY|nr:hypothetical protein EVJ58_g9443 [Rhodofomes roseus]